MKNFRISSTVFAVAATALFALGSLHAQDLVRVGGQCIGMDNKPIAGATVEFVNGDSGQKYTFKTDRKGDYSGIGLTPGNYKVSLIQNGAVIFFLNNVPVQTKPDGTGMTVDFNLPKEQARLAAAGGAQAKAAAEARAKVQAENAKIADLNKQLVEAGAAEQAGNYDQAISILTAATNTAPDKDLLWARLGQAQMNAGAKSSDQVVAKQHYAQAITAYQKALQLKPADATYHNNLGQAYVKEGDPQKATGEYTSAAAADPANASMYYFNLGAILTNQATVEADQAKKSKDIDDADAAFDKAITAKPDYAEAYYQKGINLLSKASYDKSGKIVPAPGTAEAFQKYLELQPQGGHSEEAKSIIASLGEKVETKYSKKKGVK